MLFRSFESAGVAISLIDDISLLLFILVEPLEVDSAILVVDVVDGGAVVGGAGVGGSVSG